MAQAVPWFITGWWWHDWGAVSWLIAPVAWVLIVAGLVFLVHAFALFALHRFARKRPPTHALGSWLFRRRRRRHSMLAVIFEVWFRPQFIRDLVLRSRRNGLVGFEFRERRLGGAGNVTLVRVFGMERHGESFGR
jgi:hypothetical protein